MTRVSTKSGKQRVLTLNLSWDVAVPIAQVESRESFDLVSCKNILTHRLPYVIYTATKFNYGTRSRKVPYYLVAASNINISR
jgi:hypothetical protein